MSLGASLDSTWWLRQREFHNFNVWFSKIDFVKCPWFCGDALIGGDSKVSWSLISTSIVSSMSLATFNSSIWVFYREKLNFTCFFLLRNLFLFWFLSFLELPDFRQNVNKSSGGQKLASETFNFLIFLFQKWNFSIALQKLEGSRIQNMCITHIFILGAWGASSCKIWNFVSKFWLFLRSDFQKVPNLTWKCNLFLKSLSPD